MLKHQNIVALIPARGGSKGIPRKNIKLLGGKPLISYAIRAARRSRFIDRVIVSTDDHSIARVAKKYGAEIPFMRPTHLATDTAPLIPVLQHALAYLENEQQYRIDIVILIQPTTPLLRSRDIDRALQTLMRTKLNSCVSVSPITDPPEWMYIIKGQRLIPFLNRVTPGGKRQRQQLTPLYRLNGAIYAARRDLLMKKDRLIDIKPSFVIMPRERSIDIDEPIDFKIAETLLPTVLPLKRGR